MKGWVAMLFVVGIISGYAAGGILKKPEERKAVNSRDVAKTETIVKKRERNNTTTVRLVDFSNMPPAAK